MFAYIFRTSMEACILAVLTLAADNAPALADESGLVREQKTVTVGAVREIWRLQWDRPPTAVCGADDPSVSLMCPCDGFAYGEQGELALVRIRPNGETENLELGPLFIREEVGGLGSGPGFLQHWPTNRSGPHGDYTARDNDATFVHEVVRRGSTDVMRFADYDHDGMATEFLLQVGTLPCGKHQMVLVGISKRNPHLHVFSSVEAANTPLVLNQWQWKALLGSHGTVNTLRWACGDHLSGVEWTDAISAQDGLLHDLTKSRKCSQSEQDGAPLDSTRPR